MRYRLAWIAAGATLLLGAAEIGLRGIGLGDPPLFQKNPQIGYLMAPGQEVYRLGNRIAINRYYQRSEELSAQPPAETIRTLFVGDSITFGISALDQRQTYPELVAAYLREGGTLTESANASAVSWGLGNERAYIERFGIFGSEVAVLQIGSSDLLQPTSTGDAVGVSPAQPDRKPFTAIGEALTRVAIPRIRMALRLDNTAGGEPVTTDDRELQFNENMAHFSKLITLVREEESLPVVLLVPGLAELSPHGRFRRYEPYRERFKDLVQSLSVPLIDLAEEWENDPATASYYTDGTHLTAAGNETMAKRIARELEGLCEREPRCAL